MSRDFGAVSPKGARPENDEDERRGGQGTSPRDSMRSAKSRGSEEDLKPKSGAGGLTTREARQLPWPPAAR